MSRGQVIIPPWTPLAGGGGGPAPAVPGKPPAFATNRESDTTGQIYLPAVAENGAALTEWTIVLTPVP